MSEQRPSGRSLPLAVASGVALAVLFVVTLVWHPVAVLTLIAALAVVALLELASALSEQGFAPARPVALGAGLVALYGAYLVGPAAQTVALVALLVGAVVWTVVAPSAEGAAKAVGATLMVGVWVPGLASFGGLLLARPEGAWLIAATVVITVGSDIGAYAVGSAFGRHKLAPRVSPGKTWEGAAGGLAVAAVVVVALVAPMPGLSVGAALLLGLMIVLAATLGDLTESLVKRDLGVKDLGRVLPGHGGIMDRVDSIIFALPAAHFALLAVGL